MNIKERSIAEVQKKRRVGQQDQVKGIMNSSWKMERLCAGDSAGGFKDWAAPTLAGAIMIMTSQRLGPTTGSKVPSYGLCRPGQAHLATCPISRVWSAV